MVLMCVLFLVLAAKGSSALQGCPNDDFKCSNGRCILSSWKCDSRNDCGDNSDEMGCPSPKNCSSKQMTCLNGDCIPKLWMCDGENDCEDGSDEVDCHTTTCNAENELRCDHGQCVPISWVCDGSPDCNDGTDEKNCTRKQCPYDGFKCSNGRCILTALKCDGRDDCEDNSDEISCPPQICPNDGFKCSNSRCILTALKCDGTDDCGDNSDEISCPCKAYTCLVSGECIPWSRVCDGRHDCRDQSDEGQLCISSCGLNNGSCSHKCQKTPKGSRCFCYEGYVLLEDGVSCVDECKISGGCSHFCNSTKDGFKCSCAEGYALESDRRTCKADGGEASLAYLMKDEIRLFSLVTYSEQVSVTGNFGSVIGIGYDAAEGTFFWADEKGKTINTFSTTSAQTEVFLETQQEPLFVRRDWITKNVFYTTDEGRIVCCEGNGRFCTSVITNVSSHISGFDIAPAFGLMFWCVTRHSDSKSVSGVIERANMDGSSREVIVSDNVFLPTAIAVDPVLEIIFWCDSVLGVIESTDFNGFQRRKIIGHLYPMSITVFEDHIYWAERFTNSLNRCEKFSGKDRKTLLMKTIQIKSLLIVHKAAQIRGENRCANSNCPHICLPNRTSFVCKCDDRNLTKTPRCQREQSCPEDYCPENFLCIIDGERFFCKCPPHFAGEKCEKSLQHSEYPSSEPHPFLILSSVLVVVCLCLLATVVLICRRYRKSISGSKVQYTNTVSTQGLCEASEKVGRPENEYEAVVVIR